MQFRRNSPVSYRISCDVTYPYLLAAVEPSANQSSVRRVSSTEAILTMVDLLCESMEHLEAIRIRLALSTYRLPTLRCRSPGRYRFLSSLP